MHTTWPDWIESLKERYLADAGHVFLLHGDAGAAWPIDGERLDTIGVLSRFLGRTRQVIGVVEPGEPPRFPNLGDGGRFERLVSAREVITGQRIPRGVTEPEAVLGLVFAGLMSRGSDQAWIVQDVHRIVPGHRKRVEPLGSGAPPLWDWSAALSGSNNIVLLLTPSLDAVRAELVEGSVPIELIAPQPVEAEPEAPLPDLSAAEAEVEALLAQRASPPPVPTPTPSPPPVRVASPDTTTEDPALPSVEDLTEQLDQALQLTLPLHPISSWDSRLPVMDAVARVLADYDDRVGVLELSVDEDGRPVAQGVGATDFLARWRGDVALDAAAGMLLKELPISEGADRVLGPFALHPTALRALAKRMLRLLRQP